MYMYLSSILWCKQQLWVGDKLCFMVSMFGKSVVSRDNVLPGEHSTHTHHFMLLNSLAQHMHMDSLGCAVSLCLVVCMTVLASSFLPHASHPRQLFFLWKSDFLACAVLFCCLFDLASFLLISLTCPHTYPHSWCPQRGSCECGRAPPGDWRRRGDSRQLRPEPVLHGVLEGSQRGGRATARV